MYDMHYERAVVYAKRAYKAGEEVTESYGAWSMADTMISAGYLPSHAAAAARDEEKAAAAAAEGGEAGLKAERVKQAAAAARHAGGDCVLLKLVPPVVNGSSFAAAAAGAGGGARRGGAGEGGAGDDEWAVGVESRLKEAGFSIPWRVCLSAARGTATARLVAQWAAICASASVVAGTTAPAATDGVFDGSPESGQLAMVTRCRVTRRSPC